MWDCAVGDILWAYFYGLEATQIVADMCDLELERHFDPKMI